MPSNPSSADSRWKFYEWVALAAALTAVGFFLFYIHLSEVDRITAGERGRLQVLTGVVASDIQNNLTTVDHALEGATRDFLVGHGTIQASNDLLLRLQAVETAIPGIRALFVLDHNGMVVTASKPVLLDRDLHFRDYFQRARAQPDKDMLYVSAPFQSPRKEKDLVVTVARAVIGEDGKFAGVIAAALSQDFFTDSFAPIVYAPDVWGFAVHGDGIQMMNFPQKPGMDGIDFNSPGTFFSRHRQSSQIESVVTGTMSGTGEHRMMVLRTIEPPSLRMDRAIIIGISRETAAVVQPSQRQSLIYAMFFVALALTCALALYWIQTRRARIEALGAALERERLEADNRIKLALRGANLALWSMHIPSGERWYDENCFATLGARSQDAPSDPDFFRRRIHPDDRNAYLGEIDACIDGATQFVEATFRMQHFSGHWIWILTRAQAMERDENGRAVSLMGTFMDITATKSAEQEVAHARNELQAIFDNMTEAVLVFDQSRTVIRANRTARSVLGLFEPEIPLEEVWAGIEVCLPTGEVLDREDWPTQRGFRGDFVRNAELEIRRKDSGESLFIEISVTPVYDNAQALSLLIATYSNVTERRTTHALRESEARFRTLIEDAPLAIAILRRGRFVYANPRYNILHGYAAEDDLKDLPWHAMISQESLKSLQEQEALIAQDSHIEQMFEAQGLGKEGRLVPVFKMTARVELIDGPATLIFVQDISAQKQAESLLLEARDAAEAANRSKADFLANMSHEIRSPLNGILGLAYLLEQAHLDADARNMVHRIRTSGRLLLGIINDILDVSKIDAGHMVIERSPFKLGDVIDNIASSMSIALGNKDIQLIIQVPPAGITHLLGDALRLEQVLTNLTSNAIKFTHEGRVELRITLESREGERVRLRFSVKDTGIGIAPELQTDVFKAFTQADSSTTRRFGGTGLGLTICRRLVDLMGGEIGVISTAGQGSEFWFTLPFELVAETEFSSPDMARLEALIADDSDIALKAIADIASGLGWEVKTVDSGEAVLAHIQACKGGKLPGVVILDWKMPGMDGLATARAIRECLGEEECPIVVMATAYSLSSLESHPGAEFVDAVLHKPVTSSALYNAIMEARKRRAATADTLHPTPPSTNQSLAGVRLLVVDDSEINRDVAQRILTGLGAAVALAVDGKDALDWLQAHPAGVDLVLMDVQMPVMDGIEATRRLRYMPQFKDLPIVALTAGAFKSQQDAARAAGMTHFVSKPFDVPSMAALILRLLRQSANGNGGSADTDLEVGTTEQGGTALSSASVALDVAAGLRIWSDIQTYRIYLRRFADSYANVAEEIKANLANGAREAALASIHKLAGVAGNMALPSTVRLAKEAERVLASGYDPTLVLERLGDTLKQVVAAIDDFSPTVATDASPAETQEMPADVQIQVRKLLIELMDALDTDSPDPVAPVLLQLEAHLSAAALATIRECVANFDFRGAESSTRVVAIELGVSLEDAG